MGWEHTARGEAELSLTSSVYCEITNIINHHRRAAGRNQECAGAHGFLFGRWCGWFDQKPDAPVSNSLLLLTAPWHPSTVSTVFCKGKLDEDELIFFRLVTRANDVSVLCTSIPWMKELFLTEYHILCSTYHAKYVLNYFINICVRSKFFFK